MTIVLDVSAAIQILLKKDRKKYFSEIYEKSSWVIAPDLYIAEITNVLWKYNKAGIVSADECQQYVEDGVALIDDYYQTIDLWKEVLGESIRYKHSSYDLFYAILARRNSGKLITNDKELENICKKMKIECNG
jgi:predicted nucleic acid-binding protein